MPSPQRLAAFVALVESNLHVEAIEQFYHEDASMQENFSPPRIGRALLVEREARTLARAKEVRSQKIGPALVDGDTVMINWVFDFVFLDGRTSHLDEVAVQTWSGDRILRERFYYDPAQLRA